MSLTNPTPLMPGVTLGAPRAPVTRPETYAERIWIGLAQLVAVLMFIAGMIVVLASFAPERMP